MVIDVVLDDGAYMPERAHTADAGFDLRSRTREVIAPQGSAFFDTGVRMAIPQGYAGFLKAKSGLNVKHSLTGTGLIDSGFTGTIGVKLYNHSNINSYTIEPGDKIIQIVILPLPEVELKKVQSLERTERGEGGFGSTGR
ncbi:MAG: dUTP diphosphatase [Methanobrevibacter sp.]|nr:dUTP diphosphatase [Methanobrevibacter sp.]